MEIRFHGHACFSIQGKEATVVTDPYDDSIGLKLPNLEANVVTVSCDYPEHKNFDEVSGDPRVFNWPGEYEVAGVHFRGIHSFHNPKEDKEQKENVVFLMNFNGIRLCHLGNQGTKLTPEQLEKVGDVDILFVPVGKKATVNAKKAKEIIEQIEPRVVIPMTYATDGNKSDLDPLSKFLSEMGATSSEPLDTFKVKRSDLPEDNSKVVVLNVT